MWTRHRKVLAGLESGRPVAASFSTCTCRAAAEGSHSTSRSVSSCAPSSAPSNPAGAPAGQALRLARSQRDASHDRLDTRKSAGAPLPQLRRVYCGYSEQTPRRNFPRPALRRIRRHPATSVHKRRSVRLPRLTRPTDKATRIYLLDAIAPPAHDRPPSKRPQLQAPPHRQLEHSCSARAASARRQWICGPAPLREDCRVERRARTYHARARRQTACIDRAGVYRPQRLGCPPFQALIAASAAWPAQRKGSGPGRMSREDRATVGAPSPGSSRQQHRRRVGTSRPSGRRDDRNDCPRERKSTGGYALPSAVRGCRRLRNVDRAHAPTGPVLRAPLEPDQMAW